MVKSVSTRNKMVKMANTKFQKLKEDLIGDGFAETKPGNFFKKKGKSTIKIKFKNEAKPKQTEAIQ